MLWWDTRRLAEPTDAVTLTDGSGRTLGGSAMEYNIEVRGGRHSHMGTVAADVTVTPPVTSRAPRCRRGPPSTWLAPSRASS